MKRLLHLRGRRRGTHCETCGGRITVTQPVITSDRVMHLRYADCALEVL